MRPADARTQGPPRSCPQGQGRSRGGSRGRSGSLGTVLERLGESARRRSLRQAASPPHVVPVPLTFRPRAEGAGPRPAAEANRTQRFKPRGPQKAGDRPGMHQGSRQCPLGPRRWPRLHCEGSTLGLRHQRPGSAERAAGLVGAKGPQPQQGCPPGTPPPGLACQTHPSRGGPPQENQSPRGTEKTPTLTREARPASPPLHQVPPPNQAPADLQ